MFSMVTWIVTALGILAGAWWVVDEIGDRRETAVRAELQPKIERAETERDSWKAAHKTLLEDAERLNAENKDKLKGALAAKAAAEKAVAGDADPASSVGPGRVRRPAKRTPAPGANGGGGSGLQWFQSLFGSAGKS